MGNGIDNSFDSIRAKHGLDNDVVYDSGHIYYNDSRVVDDHSGFDLSDPADRMRAQIYANKDREVGTTPLYGNKIVAKVANQKTVFEPDVKVHMGWMMFGMFVFLVGCMTIALCV